MGDHGDSQLYPEPNMILPSEDFHTCIFSSGKCSSESNMILPSEDFQSWGLAEALFGYQSSSTSYGAASLPPAPPSKNIVSERNRRNRLKQKFFALRSVVPKITKMDRASIVKDAIAYIEELHEQERKLRAEVLELQKLKRGPEQMAQEDLPLCLRTNCDSRSGMLKPSPIEVLELKMSCMAQKTTVVTLTCKKRADTAMRLCEVFESLKLQIITASISVFSGKVMKTVLIQADEEEQEKLKNRIEAAVYALSNP